MMAEPESLAPPAVEGAPVMPEEKTAPDILRNDVGEELHVAAAPADEVAAVPAVLPRPTNYRDLTSEMITGCTIGALIAYSRTAQADRNWKSVAMFQRELVRREPQNVRAYVFLSFALENIGQYEEAARVWETLIDLPGYDPNQRYAHRVQELRLRSKMTAHPAGRPTSPGRAARAVRYDLPSGHLGVTPEMIPLCSSADLIRYSMQAQQDQRWDRVEMFQWEVVKRQPRNLVAHILLVRAFVMQGKMEDARGLMPTVEELRSPHDTAHVTRSILSLRHRLGEAPPPRRLPVREAPAEDKAPALPRPAPDLRSDTAPVLKRPSNIDTSRFDNFLTSLLRTAESWPQTQGQGEGWRKIPEDERDFFIEAFGEFQKQLARAIPKGPNKAFWGKFDDINTQIHRGSINIHALGTLIDRTESAARGAKVDLGKLEPIRIKNRSAGPQSL